MSRVVLDSNVLVSALLAPAGTQATVLMLAFTGHVTLYVSTPVLAEYGEVLRRPRLRLEPRKIDAAMAAVRRPGCLARRIRQPVPLMCRSGRCRLARDRPPIPGQNGGIRPERQSCSKTTDCSRSGAPVPALFSKSPAR